MAILKKGHLICKLRSSPLLAVHGKLASDCFVGGVFLKSQTLIDLCIFHQYQFSNDECIPGAAVDIKAFIPKINKDRL